VEGWETGRPTDTMAKTELTFSAQLATTTVNTGK